MNSYFYRPNLKKFWIETLKKAIEHYEFEGNSEKYPDWEKNINETSTIEEINKIGNELRYEISLKGKRGGYWTALHMLSPFELSNLKETFPLDLVEAEKGIQKLENQNKELAHELQEEEEKVDIRNNRAIAAKEQIDNLKKEVAEQIKQREKWKTKYYQEKKRVIYHGLQLAEDQVKIKKLKESETKLKNTESELELIIQKKIEQLAKTKENEALLKKKLGKLTSKSLRLKQKNSELKEKSNSELAQTKNEKNKKIISLERRIATLTRQRNVAREKLSTLKNKQQNLKSVAQSKKVPLSLIKSENITNGFLNKNDNSLLQAVEETNDSLINAVEKVQQCLKVEDLTLIYTDNHYSMPQGKSLIDLINFYNNPPLCQNPQHVNYNAQSDHQFLPPVETQSPISPPINNPVGPPTIKEVFKDNPEQASEIAGLKQNIQKLEEALAKQKGEIVSKDKMVTERFILYFLLFLLLTIVLASILQKKKKKNEKEWKTIGQIEKL